MESSDGGGARGEMRRRFCGNSKCLHQQRSQQGREALRENPNPRTVPVAKTKTCKFYTLPSGCVRGENCNYAHETADSRKDKRSAPVKTKKILVSGLPRSVVAEDLFYFFERKFGSILEVLAIPVRLNGVKTGETFGIISFADEEALLAAIQAHNIYVYGKKVTLEVIYGRAAKDSSFCSDTDAREYPCRKLFVGEDEQQRPRSPLQIPSLYNSDSLPEWAQKFRDWLPEFLVGATKRLGEGESYPLCSLKGDFRATCGLEIDHTELGFDKLSDFIRAWPEICRPKIVPVAGGPATHLVLETVAGQPPPLTPPASIHAPEEDEEDISLLFKDIERTGIGTYSTPPKSVNSREESSSFFNHNMWMPSPPFSPTALCALCRQEAALWTALPCGHRVLCTSCKKSCEAYGVRSCFVCQERLERWMDFP